MSKTSIKKWMLFIFAFYLLAIVLLNILPIDTAEKISEDFFGDFRMDYLIHVFLFLPWTLFRCLFFKNGKLLWMIIGIFCSVAIELVQYYLPYRSFNFYDMLFNVVGLLFGYLVFIGVNLKIEESLSCNKKDEKYDYY